MELSRNNKIYVIAGLLFILTSAGVFIFTLNSSWKISINGLRTLGNREVLSYVEFYIKENPQNVTSKDIKTLLEYHPRIQSAEVSVFIKRINITIHEKTAGFLTHNNGYISEESSDGKMLQEMVVEKNHLSEDFPIFYLTTENDNELSTLKRDIIRLWESTRLSHSFIWKRVSEIVLKRDEMDNTAIEFFHSYLPVKITMYNNFNSEEFRKLWAILYLTETGDYHKKTSIRIYTDHAVLD